MPIVSASESFSEFTIRIPPAATDFVFQPEFQRPTNDGVQRQLEWLGRTMVHAAILDARGGSHQLTAVTILDIGTAQFPELSDAAMRSIFKLAPGAETPASRAAQTGADLYKLGWAAQALIEQPDTNSEGSWARRSQSPRFNVTSTEHDYQPANRESALNPERVVLQTGFRREPGVTEFNLKVNATFGDVSDITDIDYRMEQQGGADDITTLLIRGGHMVVNTQSLHEQEGKVSASLRTLAQYLARTLGTPPLRPIAPS